MKNYFQRCLFFLLTLYLSSFTLSLPTSKDENRIVNGRVIDITEVPYQAMLKYLNNSQYTLMCGAVIITDRAVLSAAHCVLNFQYKVITEANTLNNDGKMHDVAKIIKHKSYNDYSLVNDIAIFKTVGVITFNNKARAINIAPDNFDLPVGTESLVSGWGETKNSKASTELRAANVSIVAQDICKKAYYEHTPIVEGMLCANATNPPRDSCQGDSGGPLVAKNYLIGIVSWGIGCANIYYPGVYTRVSYYNSWIQENLKNI